MAAAPVFAHMPQLQLPTAVDRDGSGLDAGGRARQGSNVSVQSGGSLETEAKRVRLFPGPDPKLFANPALHVADPPETGFTPPPHPRRVPTLSMALMRD